MIRVCIADDHDIVRSGLRRLLAEDPEIRICDDASSGATWWSAPGASTETSWSWMSNRRRSLLEAIQMGTGVAAWRALGGVGPVSPLLREVP